MTGFKPEDDRALRRRPAAFSRGLAGALAAIVLVLLFAPGLSVHARLATDPMTLNDDARQQIWPLRRLVDRDLFAGDLIASYYLDCMPVGFKLVYSSSGRLVDPATMSRVLPYGLLALVMFGAGMTAFSVAGRFGLFFSLASVLGSAVYLDRMTGGLPRAFGYPILALLMLFLAKGRPFAFAILMVVSVAFYPSVAVIGGAVLALWMFFARFFSPDLGWSAGKRLALVAVSALLMLALYVPVMRSCSSWGPALSSGDVGRFPEMGAGGRYLPEDRPPFRSPAAWFLRSARSGFQMDSLLISPFLGGRGTEWLLLLAGLVGAGGSLLASRSNLALRRLWLLVPAAAAAYIAASALYPSLYIPTRYPTLSMPLFGPIAFAAGVRWLLARLPSPTEFRAGIDAGFVAGALVFVAVVAPAPDVATAGWNVRIPKADRALHSFLRTLPPDVLIAGWPGPREPIESVPYLALRPVLITWETHQAFHERYAREMRRRMGVLIELFIDARADSPRRLREDFGVTHLIVRKDPRWLERLGYMEPFGSAIRARPVRASMGSLQALLRDEKVVYQDPAWVVLELSPPEGRIVVP